MAKELKHLAQSREQIGGRFKQLRASLGLSTARMAEAVGLRERKSWEGYEAGHHLPNGSVLLVIAGLGYDVNWLLTGRGGMRFEATAARSTGLPLDEALLRKVVVACERFLAEKGMAATPDFRAKLVLGAFRLMRRQVEGGLDMAKVDHRLRQTLADVIDMIS
jgi:transcriptional regulator with XRE-family HTH domain